MERRDIVLMQQKVDEALRALKAAATLIRQAQEVSGPKGVPKQYAKHYQPPSRKELLDPLDDGV